MRFLLSATFFVATLAAQSHSQPVLGTVTEFRMGSLQIGVKPDDAAGAFRTVSPKTEAARLPPAPPELHKAKPSPVTPLVVWDTILRFVFPGMPHAPRCLWVSS